MNFIYVRQGCYVQDVSVKFVDKSYLGVISA